MGPIMWSKVEGGEGRGLLLPKGVVGRAAGVETLMLGVCPLEGTGGMDMRTLLSGSPLVELDRFTGSANCEFLLEKAVGSSMALI
jgi:hypothetical protein